MSRAAPIRVLLADDEKLVRSGFRLLLDLEDDITVVGEATTGAEAVAQARAERPDVVLMDIRMPKMDGIQATLAITGAKELQAVRILILTTYDTDAYVFEGLQAGASGFLLKDCGPAELLHGIRVVAAGEALLAPRITRRLIAQFTARHTAGVAAERRLSVLTRREREVVALVGQGLANDEIGAALFLSPATARTHVSHAMVKLGARDRAQLVVIAYRTGLVTADGRLEQLDEVAGRIGEQDLTSAGAGDHLAAEGRSHAAEPVDLGVEVVDDEMDPIAAGGGGVGGVARAPELAGPDSSRRSGPRVTSANAGAALVPTVNPRWFV